MATKFSAVQHAKLLNLLAQTNYIENYVKFCDTYAVRGDVDRSRLNVSELKNIFDANCVVCKFIKKYKVFEFDEEEFAGWTWRGSLVVQRHDLLEPMMEGVSRNLDKGVGSTLLDLAASQEGWRHLRF